MYGYIFNLQKKHTELSDFNIYFMKKCNKCLIEKELESFQKRSDSKDGYRNICRSCINDSNKKYKSKYNKKYRTENIDKIREYNKIYEQNNKEKRREYREKNKEIISRKRREYNRNRLNIDLFINYLKI